MVFSSPIFIFLFLPVTVGLYLVVRKEMRNTLLLFASLTFYAWGEPLFVLVMLLSIFANYLLGLWMDQTKGVKARLVLIVSLLFNLGLLGYFKYANFLVTNINWLLNTFSITPISLAPVKLPIGISFFTFQIMSYIIDVYRKETPVQRNPLKLALYISLFPQLIAGPIVRYHDVAEQISNRNLTLDGFSYGVKRFVTGLGKKVLIANTVAVAADGIFGTAANQLTTGMAWLGILCYSLQIYYDFSGYSDMAIGLGNIFGFKFLENFNYPYISGSIKEFWRRWHISLSTWFRDYLYIPMGGNRCKPARAYINLVIVFLLCGLWHGASWSFAVWGLYHGFFLVVERLKFGRFINSLWKPLCHAYALIVVMVGWVFFRSDTLGYALGYLKAMVGFAAGTEIENYASIYINNELLLAAVIGIIGALPLVPLLSRRVEMITSKGYTLPAGIARAVYYMTGIAVIMAIFAACALSLASGTYNPFIYFRF